jgi:hypothetical protein
MKHVSFTGAGRLSHTRQALTDLDVQVLIRPDDLTPSSNQIIVGEYLTTGNKRGWFLRLDTGGTVRLQWSTNGTATSAADSTATLASTGLTDGSKFWLRATLDVNVGGTNKEARFYTSDDGITWTQLGATVNTATTTSIYSDAANVITMAGEGTAASYTGKFYEVRLYSAIGGSTNLVDPDPWDWSTATYGATGTSVVTPALAAVEQDAWPPRVALTGTSIETDDVVTLYRVSGSTRTAVRGAVGVTAGDTAIVRIDAELPFGTPLSYVMDLNGEEEYATSPMTVTLVGGKVAVSDAITGAAAEVVITSWPEKRTARPSTTFVVGGRNVAVVGQRPGFTASIEFETDTDAARENFETLLTTATSGILQIRQDGEYGGVDCYICVLSDTEARRDETDGTDERRRWVLEAVEVEAWAADVAAAGFTWQDLIDAYTGLTWQDLIDDHDTWLDVAQAEFGV